MDSGLAVDPPPRTEKAFPEDRNQTGWSGSPWIILLRPPLGLHFVPLASFLNGQRAQWI